MGSVRFGEEVKMSDQTAPRDAWLGTDTLAALVRERDEAFARSESDSVEFVPTPVARCRLKPTRSAAFLTT